MNAPARAVGIFALAALGCANQALAQFANIQQGVVREQISGTAFPGASADAIEAGDQLGAFFNGQLIGSFSFTSATGPDFEIVITGDDPDTPATEGPTLNDSVEFRFFDASTNFVINNILVETAGGERFNFTFQGIAVPEIAGFPIDLTPSRSFNVRITEGGGGGGGNGGGGGGTPGTGADVNGDGKIDNKDIAIVIRAIVASRISNSSSAGDRLRERLVTAAELQSADVNDDGVVSTQDVLAIVRARNMVERPSARRNTSQESESGA